MDPRIEGQPVQPIQPQEIQAPEETFVAKTRGDVLAQAAQRAPPPQYKTSAHAPKLQKPKKDASKTPPKLHPESDFAKHNQTFLAMLTRLQEEHTLTDTDFAEIVQNYQSGNAPQDPILNEMLNELQRNVEDSLQAPIPDNVRQNYQDNLSQNYSAQFEDRVPQETRDPLLSEHYIPEYTTGHFEEAAGILHDEVLGNLGLDEPPPIDSDAFLGTITTQYDQRFEEMLQDKGLTELEFRQATFLHYFPDTPFPEHIQNIVNEIHSTLIGEIQRQYGLNDDFDPQPNRTAFEMTITGDLQYTFDKLLKQQGLNPEEMQLAFAYISGQGDALLPDHIKNIVDNVQAQAVGMINERYGIPEGWKTDTEIKDILSTITQTGWHVRMGYNTISYTEDYVELINNAIKDMPDSGDKSAILNVLKTVSEAITKLKQLIFLIQGKDSDIAMKYSKAEFEATMSKLDKQREELKEIHEKRRKQEKTAKVMKIFSFIMAPLNIALSMVGGPIGIALAVIMMIDQFDDKSHLMKDMFDAIDESIEKTGHGEDGKNRLKALAKIGVCLALTVVSLNISSCSELFFSQSGAIEDMVESMGGSKQDAMWVTMALQVVVAVAIMVVSFKVVDVVKNAVKIPMDVLKIIDKVMKIQNVMEVFATTVGVAQQATNIAHNVYNGQIAMQKGDMDAYVAEMEALIQVLQKLSQKILNSLRGMGDFAADVNATMGQIWKGASETATGVGEALRG